MAAAKTKDDDTARMTEIELVERWRIAALSEAGLSGDAAATIGARLDIDLHRTVAMWRTMKEKGHDEALLMEIIL